MIVRVICGIAIAVLMSLASFAEQPPQPLSGRVVDEQDQPVAGAKVSMYEVASGGWAKTVYTKLASINADDKGCFVFKEHGSKRHKIIVANKAGKSPDWWLSTLPLTKEIVLRLVPAAALDGEIVDEAGKAVPDATVQAALHDIMIPLPEGILFGAKTDANGRFHLSDLPATGSIKLDITKPGYAHALVEGPFIPGQKGICLVLPPEGRIEGIVVEKESGRPLSNVRLYAMSGLACGMNHAYAKTDDAGRFVVCGLSGGKYEVETIGEIENDILMPPTWLGSIKKIAVEAGKQTANVKIEAVQGGMLEIIFADAADGKPIKTDAHVTISPAKDLRIWHSESPSSDGIIRMHLLPGEYVVANVMSVQSVYKEEERKPFTIEKGKTKRITLPLVTNITQNADVPVKAELCASGIVCDTEGKPVAKAKIQVLPLFGGKKELLADNDGKFSIKAADIGPVACIVCIRHPDKNLMAIGIAAVGEDEPNENELRKSGNVIVRSKPSKIILRKPVVLEGVVSDEKGKPVVGASVSLKVTASHMGQTDVLAETKSDKDGKYQLALYPFTITGYLISAKAPGYSITESQIESSNLILESKPTHDLKLLAANRTVHGVVVDGSRKPVPGTVITAKRSGGPKYPGCVVSDAQGHFVLEQLDNADTIYLFAQVPGRGWVEQNASTIHPGDTKVELRVGPCYWE